MMPSKNFRIYTNRFLVVFFLTGLLFSCKLSTKKEDKVQVADKKTDWWKEAVVYQIYPRSFKDSDGDGVGDLKGIISKLDYLKSIGIDAIWLNPIYTSPNDDNGYDISDYRSIMKEFGSMEDFDALLKGMHERGIKLVMDLVVNHSSDEHEWFKQSRSSRTNPYRNYYHWWPAEKGNPPYRWSFFDVKSEAWRYDTLTKAYYLHYFSKKQPDLNWENPKLRQEVYDVMKFWLNKGIDGFRMDAFQFASKDTTWPILPKGYEKNVIKYYGNGPHLHDYLQEMNREVYSKYNVMSVSEGAGSSPEDAMKFVDPDRKELNIAYHFESVDIGKKLGDYGLVNYKKIFSRYDSVFKDKGWLAIFMANHDQPRMVSKFGNDSTYREVSSKLLSTFVLTMRGTPFYYNGDELGMKNIRFNKIEDYNDVDIKNKYENLKNTGGNISAFLEDKKETSRDNGRTPFQWNSEVNAGFTTGTPWLKINPNYTTVNAAAQEKDSNSVLNYFRKIITFRKNTPALIYGAYKLYDAENPKIFAYTRTLNAEKYLIVLNFTSSETEFILPEDLKSLTNVKLTNYGMQQQKIIAGNIIHLQPWQSVILK